jgi:hypothetical protein
MAVCMRSNDTPSSQTSVAVIAVRIATVPLSGSAVPLPCQSGPNKQKLRRSTTPVGFLSCFRTKRWSPAIGKHSAFSSRYYLPPRTCTTLLSVFIYKYSVLHSTMSYRGRPSKGCESCRARKVRVSQAVAVSPHFGQPSCSSMLLYRLDWHTLLQPSQLSKAKWG